jgi:hypothetical protein
MDVVVEYSVVVHGFCLLAVHARSDLSLKVVDDPEPSLPVP